MEKKQLNLNAPLLSVRRIPSSLVSPNVQNGVKTEKSFLSRRYTLPSHTDCNLDQVTEPVAVPFMWERIPGRPKSKSGPLFLPRENHSISPSILSQRFKDSIQQSSKGVDNNKVFKIRKEALSSGNSPRMERMKVSDRNKESSDSENENDVFSDALEILSPTESFSFSCVSDSTGYTDPNTKPSRRFNADPYIRDFMLRRFLPAARAMALEPTPYIARKKALSSEQPREAKEVVSVDKPLPNPHESSIIVDDIHESDNDDIESEEVCSSPAKIPDGACGFLPLFCAKNSACILNTVEDTRGRSSIPKVYASEVRRLARAAYMGPQSQPPNKQDMPEARSMQKLDSTIQSHGITEGNKKVSTKQADESNQFIAHSRGLQETYTPTPQRPSGRRCISPYRNQRSESPFREGVGFLGIPRAAEKDIRSNKFQGILPHQRKERDLGSARLTAEKILYIDSSTTVHKKEDLNPGAASVKDPVGSADENNKNCVLLIPKVSASLVADMLSKSNIPFLKGASGLVHSDQEIKPLGLNKVSAGSDERINSEPNAKEDNTEGSTVCTLQSPFPPLPKTPAHSWLWRVLPSVTANRFSDSRKISRKTSSSTKWETVVRTSKMQYDHTRYSEELTTHFQKHLKK